MRGATAAVRGATAAVRGATAAVRGAKAAKTIPGVCFVAGTEIETEAGGREIESLRVGERVTTTDGDSSTEVDPGTWRKIKMRMPNPECPSDILDLELLRSLDWMADTGCQPGARMWFELEEMGLRGWADVLSVSECPPIQPGLGRVVLATVTHENTLVMELRLEGQAEPLRPTDRHRLFSVTRNDWVPTASLQPGEELRTATGAARIASVQPWPGTHRVFNIEVETEHSYFAGKSKVLSHNTNLCGLTSVEVTAERIIFREPQLWQGNINNVKPFNAALSAKQPIYAVRAADGSVHIMNGNHRVMGALQTGAETGAAQKLPMALHTPEQWEALTGSVFNPAARNATSNPAIVPGIRPTRR